MSVETLHIVFFERDIFFFDSLMNTKLKRAAFVQNLTIYVFTMTFYSFNASLLNKSINFFKKINNNYWPQTFE